ncbi:MAG TPA: hypothetical protein VFA58_05925 [Chthoniobacterales bacterium]|nr:hypothetical protein [Chthoniobacterales bacterium]
MPDPKSEVGVNGKYTKLYEGKLFLTPGKFARFVQLPGPLAQTEFAFSIYKKSKQPGNYWITLTEPTRRLADCGPIEPGLPKVNPNTIQVRRYDARLPDSTALALRKVWVGMLRQAPTDPCKDCSGESTTEIFSAVTDDGKFLEGIFVYPGSKTLALARIAIALEQYCHASISNRERIGRDIEKKALELEKRIARRSE